MNFQSLSIRARLLLLSLGLVIPLAAAGFFNLWSFWQLSRAQLETSLMQQAKLAAKAFEEQLSAHRQTMMTVSMVAAAKGNSFTLKDYLDSVVETRPQWLDLQIVNRNGDVVLAQSRKPKNLQTDSVKYLKDAAERENSFVISAEESPDKKLHYLSLAQPIGNGDFVVARVDVASANDVFENLNVQNENIIAVYASTADKNSLAGKQVNFDNARVVRVVGPRTFTIASGNDEIYVMLDDESARAVGTQGKIDKGDAVNISGEFEKLQMEEINDISNNRFRPLTEAEREFLKKTQVFLQANKVSSSK